MSSISRNYLGAEYIPEPTPIPGETEWVDILSQILVTIGGTAGKTTTSPPPPPPPPPTPEPTKPQIPWLPISIGALGVILLAKQ